jgi:hypothetical protein
MRIQRNRRSRSAVAALVALSRSQQRCAALHLGQRRAAGVYRPFLLALTDSPMQVWPGRGLPSPSRKGAGVWLPR